MVPKEALGSGEQTQKSCMDCGCYLVSAAALLSLLKNLYSNWKRIEVTADLRLKSGQRESDWQLAGACYTDRKRCRHNGSVYARKLWKSPALHFIGAGEVIPGNGPDLDKKADDWFSANREAFEENLQPIHRYVDNGERNRRKGKYCHAGAAYIFWSRSK